MNYYEIIDPKVKEMTIQGILGSCNKLNFTEEMLEIVENISISLVPEDKGTLLITACFPSRRVLVKSDTLPVKDTNDQIKISKEEYDVLVEADHLEEE
jgi:hypothetical protein